MSAAPSPLVLSVSLTPVSSRAEAHPTPVVSSGWSSEVWPVEVALPSLEQHCFSLQTSLAPLLSQSQDLVRTDAVGVR